METADTGTKVRSLFGERPVGLSRDLSHRGGENRNVPLAPLGAPTLGACRGCWQDRSALGERAETAPFDLARATLSGRRQPFEVPFEIDVFNLSEIAPFERIGASFDLGAEDFQLEAVFATTLLKDSEGVADGFARVLVLASFDDLLDKGILLGGQADVSGRHLASLQSP